MTASNGSAQHLYLVWVKEVLGFDCSEGGSLVGHVLTGRFWYCQVFPNSLLMQGGETGGEKV